MKPDTITGPLSLAPQKREWERREGKGSEGKGGAGRKGNRKGCGEEKND